jgi:hypothetical protein
MAPATKGRVYAGQDEDRCFPADLHQDKILAYLTFRLPGEERHMAFDENLATRIRTALARKKAVVEKKMFGGVGFLLNGNMLVGVWKNSMIVRLGPEQAEEALLEQHVGEFDITGSR